MLDQDKVDLEMNQIERERLESFLYKAEEIMQETKPILQRLLIDCKTLSDKLSNRQLFEVEELIKKIERFLNE